MLTTLGCYAVIGTALLRVALGGLISRDSPPMTDWIEPFPYLNGGSFSGSASTFNPDPLAAYVWPAIVNTSQLQVVFYAPDEVSVLPPTLPSSFKGYESMTTAGSQFMIVSGNGTLRFTFAVESAAWLEFDSPDLTAADAAHVSMSISENSQVYVTELGPKTAVPVPYPRADGNVTYRLELNPDLYEGVRFGWLHVNATPSHPWTVTGFRSVAQVKPTNWVGAFAAAGDDLLTRVWYAGAYTVKLNLLSDQFGAILMYRGDRYAWTGDDHVAQSTAMYAFGDFQFVFQNMNFTRNNCNGIESYCLYLVLSVCEYFQRSGDSNGTAYMAQFVTPKLEHANSLLSQARPPLGFYGWDDSLGSGFLNATCDEAEAAYRFLAIRAFKSWAAVLTSLGQSAAAQHFSSYAAVAVASVRARGPAWYTTLGVYATADALNAGFATSAEAAAMIARQLNDSVSVCGLSNFNTYFVLQALSAVGDLDRGLTVLHHCWDGMVLLGSSTVWEAYRPDWATFLQPYDAIPGFEMSYTSMCHPWSSGATTWASTWLLGVHAVEPGYNTVIIAPHIAGNMTGVSGVVSTRHGAIAVNVTSHGIQVALPHGVSGELHMSDVLLRRLGVSVSSLKSVEVMVSTGAACAMGGEPEHEDAATLLWQASSFAPTTDPSLHRTQAVVVALTTGCTLVRFAAAVEAVDSRLMAVPNPFPPPRYPATFIARDAVTSGSWIDTYGKQGFIMFAYDGAGAPIGTFPSFISAVNQSFGRAQDAQVVSASTDTRALQNPAAPAGLRSLGQYFCGDLPWGTGWDPSFVMDVYMSPDTDGAVAYQFAVYVVDFDREGRRQTVELFDRWTLQLISPVQYLDDFEGGVWLVWQYNRSVRFRFNYVSGKNQVVSAIMFDGVKA